MTISAKSGPEIVFGQQPALNGYTPDYNPDTAPSLYAGSVGLLDQRYGFREGGGQAGSGNNANLAVGFPGTDYIIAVNGTPSTIATANIAALANPTTGTALTLVSTTGAGITVLATAFTPFPSLNVIPVGALAIDGLPATTVWGQTGSILTYNPSGAIARAVSLTGVASGTGGAVTVRGADIYGYPMSETITMTSGATTTNGKKAFKFIYSVTPGFTDTHTISVGTTDIYGLPLVALSFSHASIYWNTTMITAGTGFVAADTTSPATAITGCVTGTYATQSASDGTKTLQIFITPSSASLTSTTGLYGVPNFTN